LLTKVQWSAEIVACYTTGSALVRCQQHVKADNTMEDNLRTKADPFFREYSSPEAIAKYTRATAGAGINSLLEREYKEIYLEALQFLPSEMRRQPLQILEFGCGGGMNLLHLVSVLSGHGLNIQSAIGTDFSPVLIEAANKEARSYLSSQQHSRVQFGVAKNETLFQDLSTALGQDSSSLENSFQFIIGVNTIRYCHRAGKQLDCACDILRLLAPGGVCVVIDMNDRFPAFRDALKNKLRRKSHREEEEYLPSLQEYTAPFQQTGFKVCRSENFCWIPHSGGRFMTGLLRAFSPVLNVVARSRAMRSLVVAQKPVRL
jgi:SAM-dependent methyltransferase